MTTAPLARLLIVDDEASQMKALCNTLEPEGYVTTGYTSAVRALASLHEQEYDLLLTDLTMPEMDGIALLQAAREIDNNLVGIVMTGHGSIDTAVKAMQGGALDYILKPFRLNVILPVLSRALAVRQLQAENIQLRESVAIYELSTALTHGLDFDVVLQKAADSAIRHTDAGSVCILLPSADGTSLYVAAARGEHSDRLLDRQIALTESVTQWVGRSREELAPLAGWSEPRALTEHPFAELITGIALPMVARDELVGILGFSSTRRIRPGQVKALNILAGSAASTLVATRALSELRAMNEELEQRVRMRTRELEAANRDLESFSYSVSHDLRAPLRAVQGFCEIYLTDYASTIPEEARPLLDHVLNGAKRMSQLIEDLLTFSRFSRQPLTRQRVLMDSLARRVLDELIARQPERRVEARIQPLPDCLGDASLIEQVLVNLFSNALKFTRRRDPAVIEMGCTEEPEELVYFVRDNGAGFDMKYGAKLFGVFQRLHSASEFEGTGVGLSIVQRIVERHGGRTWAEGKIDEGATFFFSLPRAEQN